MGWIRRRWRRLRGEAAMTVTLRSPITWDRFDRACYALGLDPEAVRTKGRGAWKDVVWPDVDKLQEFIDIVAVGRYDLKNDFEISGAREFVVAVAGFFLVESQMNSSELGRLAKSSSRRQAFQFQMERESG